MHCAVILFLHIWFLLECQSRLVNIVGRTRVIYTGCWTLASRQEEFAALELTAQPHEEFPGADQIVSKFTEEPSLSKINKHQLSIRQCVQKCFKHHTDKDGYDVGYFFAAMFNGDFCGCSNDRYSQTQIFAGLVHVDESYCYKRCPGVCRQRCGGRGAAIIFATGYYTIEQQKARHILYHQSWIYPNASHTLMDDKEYGPKIARKHPLTELTITPVSAPVADKAEIFETGPVTNETLSLANETDFSVTNHSLDSRPFWWSSLSLPSSPWSAALLVASVSACVVLLVVAALTLCRRLCYKFRGTSGSDRTQDKTGPDAKKKKRKRKKRKDYSWMEDVDELDDFNENFRQSRRRRRRSRNGLRERDRERTMTTSGPRRHSARRHDKNQSRLRQPSLSSADLPLLTRPSPCRKPFGESATPDDHWGYFCRRPSASCREPGRRKMVIDQPTRSTHRGDPMLCLTDNEDEGSVWNKDRFPSIISTCDCDCDVDLHGSGAASSAAGAHAASIYYETGQTSCRATDTPCARSNKNGGVDGKSRSFRAHRSSSPSESPSRSDCFRDSFVERLSSTLSSETAAEKAAGDESEWTDSDNSQTRLLTRTK